MSDIIVGIDGGGTKTRVECYEAGSFRLVGTGAGGACNIAAMPLAEAVASVAEALRVAGIETASVRAACAAVAGYSHELRRLKFHAALSSILPNALVGIAPDYEAAFRSALPNGSGALVIAGTGSIAYARSGDGLAGRAGGYGYLIDDAGSGYGVGRQALAAILASREGVGETTSLDDYAARLLEWPDREMERDAVVREVYYGSLSRDRIASLSQAVAEACDGGDQVARRILMHAGGALARLANAAIRQAYPGAQQPISVARIGGLWRAGTALTDVFERSLARFAPSSVLAESAGHEPAWGASLMALDSLMPDERGGRLEIQIDSP